jgi:predicted aldo/keto reductase-like oxidoreductase
MKVTRIGFGGIPIQRVAESDAVAVVTHALKAGADFIDTARAYTTSEARIGMALQEIDIPVTLASKSPARTADAMRRDIELSLNDLKRQRIDLYQCHFVKNQQEYAQVISPGGALDGLLKARDEGLIGHIGITSHSLDLLEAVLDDDIFETIMVCFSFLEPAAADMVIPKALAKNVGVIAMKPFSGGALMDPALALKYVLGQPDILVIPGVETRHLFDANWEIFQGDWTLTAADIDQITKVRGQYAQSFCRRCDYCQPCSEEIPIQQILGLRFAVQRFGEGFLDKDWVQAAIDKARNCSQCGECLSRCPYELPIPDLIENNLDWLDQR